MGVGTALFSTFSRILEVYPNDLRVVVNGYERAPIMNDWKDHKALLKQAGLLYQMHEAGRSDPFNVFSVLRKESDEVNLHSRFLAALLNHRKSRHAPHENLKDFLENVVEGKFEDDGATVDREHDDIDILIANKKTKQAVAIENKINAHDQPEQLQRYHDKLKGNGYDKILMLYLTLHGRDPSEDSVGNLPPDKITNISYKSDLPPWLERCQERAYDEPALRESVAQYLHLIRKMNRYGSGGNIHERVGETLHGGRQPCSRP